jgi:hypothetical protein
MKPLGILLPLAGGEFEIEGAGGNGRFRPPSFKETDGSERLQEFHFNLQTNQITLKTPKETKPSN